MRALLFFLSLAFFTSHCQAGDTLDEIKARQMVRCGVSMSYPGLATKDDLGNWSGIEIDFCRAFAAAVLGDSAKVAFQPLPIHGRFSSLLSREVDILARNTSQTIGRESQLGVLFAGPLFVTGQSFLVPANRGINDLAGLDNTTICVLKGSTHISNLEYLGEQHGLHLQPKIFDTDKQVLDAFLSNQCAAITEDMPLLAAARSYLPQDRSYVLFSSLYSKEMISLAVRQSDVRLYLAVKAVLSALVTAEEIGFTAHQATQRQDNEKNVETRLFLRKTDALANSLGFVPGWAMRTVETVGNYGEMYERNLGKAGPLRIERGSNRLVRDGGMIYATPF